MAHRIVTLARSRVPGCMNFIITRRGWLSQTTDLLATGTSFALSTNSDGVPASPALIVFPEGMLPGAP